MHDLNVIDHFLQAFITYIDSGFGLLGPDVGFLTATLIGIDITLAGLFWAMGGEDNVIGRFLRKILYVGAFAFILNSFSTLADIIFRSFAQPMRLAFLPAIAGLGLASPMLAQTPLHQVATATRTATVEPAASAFVNGAQVYPYSEGTIFQAYAAPGLVTDIVLQPGEALIAVASGDTARWVIGDTTSGSGEARQAHVLVKPFAAGLVTNLLITTDRRAYHVRLVSSRDTALSSMRWTYPQDELVALKRAAETAQAAAPVAVGLSVEQLHFNYAISGDRPGWRPLRAFDDGQKTYIEFPASLATGEAPPLFLVDPEGKAELVNYRLRDRFYVVDHIFDAAELRLGLKKQQIVRIERITAKPKRRGA